MQAFIGLTQLAQSRFEKCLVLVFLSGTQGCQSVQTHIDANGSLLSFSKGIWEFNGETHKPPVRRFRDSCACHLAFEAQVLRHIHPSEFGDPDAMIPKLDLIIGKVETGLASLLAFELGTTFPFPAFYSFKERGESFAQVQKVLI